MTDPLRGMDLVIFDMDGTLIGFDHMWATWAVALGDRLSTAVGRDVRPSLFLCLGYDDVTGIAIQQASPQLKPASRRCWRMEKSWVRWR